MTATIARTETLVIQLDEEQSAIVHAESSDRMLVIAGAGQGKTEIVTSRIARLVSEDKLSPVDEILVLTFSRAAVEAVRKRLADRDVVETAVRTFDSFASRLLLDAEIDPSSIRGGYEARIRRATEVLTGEDLPYSVEAIRHLVLDEIQDLVGDRAEFVLALLRRLPDDAGFTALGDPLQAVYDFQLDSSRQTTTSDQVFRYMTDEMSASQVGLSVNYRARGRDAKSVVALGHRLRTREPGDDALRELDSVARRMPDLGAMAEAAPTISSWSASTAILCRTNADALRVSKSLSESSAPHTLRRPAQEIGANRWIAEAFASVESQSIEEDEVEDLLSRTPSAPEFDEAWMLLKAADQDPRSRGAVNVSRLRAAVRANALPWGLLDRPANGLVVSTVHRAKGLEFDRVVVIRPDFVFPNPNIDREVRERYVALSRARDDIYQASPDKIGGCIKKDDRVSRWVQHSFAGRGRLRPNAMEFRHSDVESKYPASMPHYSALELQRSLIVRNIVGQPVTGWLDSETARARTPRYYLSLGADLMIGLTSEQFGFDFSRVFNRAANKDWPARLTGLTVTAVETVGGEPEFAKAAGVGDAGFWLVPRILGLARPEWRLERDS